MVRPPTLIFALVPLARTADTNRLRISGDEEGSSKANLNFWSGITKAKPVQSKRVMSIFSGGMVAETSQDSTQKLVAQPQLAGEEQILVWQWNQAMYWCQ